MKRIIRAMAAVTVCVLATACNPWNLLGEDAVAGTDDLCQQNDAGWCPP